MFAAHYHLPGEPTGPYTYGRDENPTWTRLERAIAELEAPGAPVGPNTPERGSGTASGAPGMRADTTAGEGSGEPADASTNEDTGTDTGTGTGTRTGTGTDTHEDVGATGEAAAAGRAGPGAVEALVFASGMAATSAVIFSQVRAGDVVVLPGDGYQALPLIAEQLTAYGVEVRTAPTGGDAQLGVLDGARLLWLETPSNPGLDVCNVRRLAAQAHARGALVAVDNTLATPLGQRPLELGADFSVASGTKQLTGHGDVLLGYVAGRDASLMAAVRRWRKIAGAIPGPMEAWLAHRSLPTLHLRAERQNANALALAEALTGRPDVTGLRYPGLPGDPAHRLAAAQMRRFGCVVSFTLPTRARAERFLSELRLVDDATSFGGVRSTAERRGRWGGDDVPEGFIRFSAGVEDTVDLVRDVLRALDAAAREAR
nr:cystathionine gamma-lyase [Streptomyces sp. TS71-3]